MGPLPGPGLRFGGSLASNHTPRRTVLVRGDRIVAVGPAGEVAIPAGSTLVDGRGRFLMPGLVDMHVHALLDPSVPPVFFPLFVANGVTTVRDMGGILDLLPCAELDAILGR